MPCVESACSTLQPCFSYLYNPPAWLHACRGGTDRCMELGRDCLVSDVSKDCPCPNCKPLGMSGVGIFLLTSITKPGMVDKYMNVG